MKKRFATFLGLASIFCGWMLSNVESVLASELWLDNYSHALEAAQKDHKPILLNFTGSDWCGWCQKLQKELFSQPDFLDYAKGHLILMVVDFPQNIPQSPAVKAENLKLREKFHVEGFPTLILLNSAGQEIASHTGYLEGGVEGFKMWVQQAVQKSSQ